MTKRHEADGMTPDQERVYQVWCQQAIHVPCNARWRFFHSTRKIIFTPKKGKR